MDELKELTKAEEQIMQALWDRDGGFVKEIIDMLPEPKPAYNTVSTIIRILETKGFVDHESFGKSHRYFPKIQKEEYKKLITGKLLQGYFENSASSMLSFFLEEKKLDVKDMDEILKLIQKHKS
ncbi:BlaI/MecI/CopY family transcriptional regulator [Sphingobacterium hotanense]|uniref:BlaI/MecI/CopY family transcriptional regulator n=1 Tax=Sphingobacterium hotanense TaxID=649196 RepID=A0ABT7NPH0_9SPHI|nr:BlaI/MecI/CopY family transcriptional regulator [Sphingobacterium hotanense]MCT1524579.1 BlaI/MecI/CopY family transcriptional regulator [Sphingobacterium hotanense]MDM1049142.1 BlaI/MecI/CopY family transcriptional regulator [Sphingobacterium hotanense]